MRLPCVLAMILALTTTSVAAAMYKWTDADGNTQYGQHPPAGVQVERIKPSPQPTAQQQPALTPQQRLQQLEAQQQKQREQQAEAAAEEEKAEAIKQNCEIARKNLANLQMGGHRLTRLADGSYTRLTEEERLSRIAEAEKNIEKYCP